MSTVTVMPATQIDFAPATVEQEVIQNIATLLSTIRYTVPYDRLLGLNPDYLDESSQVVRARYQSEVIAMLRERESRCQVIEVTFQEDTANGQLIPTVKVTINV